MRNVIRETAPPYYLAFQRHGEKGKRRRSRQRIEGQPPLERIREPLRDEDVQLTVEGGMKAVKKGPPFKGGLHKYTIFVDSGRVRTLQTIAFRALPGWFTGRETGAEVEEKIRRWTRRTLGKKTGGKVSHRENLNFNTGSGEYKQALREAVKAKNVVPFMLNESDPLAERLGEKKVTTYIRAAGGIAREILGYATASVNLQRIYESKPDEVKATAPPFLPRMMGSHQPILESFLIRVTEKLKGAEARDELVKHIGDAGFSPLEGYTVTVHPPAEGGEPTIRLNYSKTDKFGNVLYSASHDIPRKVLEEIAAEKR